MGEKIVQHPEYTRNVSRWTRCRTAAEGEDAVKAAGELYLPKLGGQTDPEYQAYKKRALYFNATGRTVDGLSGLVFRVAPILDYPAGAAELVEDLTGDGTSAIEVAEIVIEELVKVGKAVLLIDHPTVDRSDLTVAEARGMGLRPKVVLYQAERLIYWKHGNVQNRTVLVQAVLEESYTNEKGSSETQFRRLSLDDAGYLVEILRKNEKSGEFEVIEDSRPLMNGAPIREIPLYVVTNGREGRPPILDLVDVNLSHYRTMADLENGAHWAGVPTPVFIGSFSATTLEDSDIVAVRLGSSSGIHMQVGSDAKFLEFTGSGLGALETRAKAKEEMMAVLGARMLASEGRQVEAAETAAIHRAGESSVLAALAQRASQTLTKVLQFCLDWAGIGGTGTVSLNTDFMPVPMSAQELTALVAAHQQGALSSRELFDALQKGEVVAAGKSFEDHQDELEQDGPALGTMGV